MTVYQNRFLKLDLSKREAVEAPLDPEVVRDFLGGRGFGIEYLYRHLSPHTDPLSPDNILLFLPGILGGTSAPGFSRWIAAARSPLTGAYIRSVCGGKFGAAIKTCGYEFIAIHGRADRPTYVHLSKEGAEFLDADGLWGLDTAATQERIWDKSGKSNTRIACIGPAGENLVKFAAIIHEKRAAARGGVGAVMGSKNLKAVAINTSGGAAPALQDRETFLKLVQEHNEILKTHDRRKKMTAYGTTFMTSKMHALGIFPVRNFQEGGLPGVEKIGAEAFQKLKTGDYGCYACTTRCGNIFKAAEGPYKGAQSEGPEYETVFSFGGEIANTDPGAIIAADALCDRLGIDTISMGVVAGFVMELYEKGILSSEELDGLKPEWGDHRALFQLIEKVASREGIGNILAEGTRKAGQLIGKGAEYYAMTAKGLELPGYEPRAAKAHGLGYAVSNIGGSHMYGYARQEISGFMQPREIDRLADDGKGDIAGWNQIKKAVEETGILCNFADTNVTQQLICDLYVSATGRSDLAEPKNMDKFGERIVCLERCFNVREGFSRKDDTLPDRMFKEPLKNAGPSTGAVIRKMDNLLDEYYDFMGYDKNGIPTAEKLKELGLADLASEMESFRK
ncbi:MAG: aldehyde ferredoxin oxidoreductase family protein [Syntrophobacterales bacterium]|nr:aldehyde ferredoxin oxidoreductase family protein [Syntrophobacterales bacterium]